MKFFKEVISMAVILLLLGAFAWLSPYLVLPKSRMAKAPTFQEQDFSFELIPLQVVQTWILEQQSVSKDIEVQETLKKFAKQVQVKKNPILEGFTYNPFGAVGLYVLSADNQRYTCYFFAGKNQTTGWLSNKYYAHKNGLFLFTNSLDKNLQQHFEAALQKATWPKRKFEARKLRFELSHQPYLLEWHKHGFALHMPKEKQNNSPMLVPSGFHVSCPLALQNLFGQTVPLNGLTALSMNYHGAKLNNQQGLELEFEGLLSFQNQTKRKAFLSAIQHLENDWEWHPNYVRVNDANYGFKESGKQLYICSQPQRNLANGVYKQTQKLQPLYCSGDPLLLTKLENAGWAAAVLELFPIYRALHDLSERTQSVRTEDQKITWQLYPRFYAAGEFLKLFGTAVE